MNLKFKIIFVLVLSVCFFTNAQPFRYIVATDGSGDFTNVQSAIDACPDNERSIVFVKNGTYYGATSIGSKTASSSKIISLIGENQDSVILTYDKWLGTANGGVATFELATTFQIYAKNFYAENITFQNSSGNKGQALALYTAGDMSIFKNCKLLGYQDTYRSKKGTRGYFSNCWIEGAVDFIYAGGTIIFDDCTVNCINAGGYVVAPEDAYATIPKASTQTGIFIRLGFIFRNCLVKGANNVPTNSFYLGRPWGDYAGAIYLNCKLSNQVNSAGWTIMGSSTYLTSCFAEYNSTDLNGIPVDTTKRISWSYQLKQADVDNLLTPSGVYARNYTSTFDPISSIFQTNAPANILVSNTTVSWDAVPNSIGYIVYKNGKYLTSLIATNFTDNSGVFGTYTVYSLNNIGTLSKSSDEVTGVSKTLQNKTLITIERNQIKFSEHINIEIYDASGKKIVALNNCKSISTDNIPNGTYILRIFDNFGNYFTKKIALN